jgi:hypothetical protein
MKLRRTLFFFFFSLLFVACAPTLQQVAPNEAKQKWLPFLENGKTTKEEVLLKLGIPSTQFQGERIFTYRLVTDGTELMPAPREVVATRLPTPGLMSGWSGSAYNLVVIFDERGVLQRHSLIKVK